MPITKEVFSHNLQQAVGFKGSVGFLKNFNFLRGDVIFGIGSVISEYWHLFELYDISQAFFSEPANRNVNRQILVSPKQVEKRFFKYQQQLRVSASQGGQHIISRSNTFINFSGNLMIDANEDGSFSMNLRGHQSPAQQDFFNRLSSNNKFGIGDLNHNNGLEKIYRAQTKDNTRHPNRCVDPISIRNYMIRRGCKLLIWETIDKGATIHYALDDIDISIVANCSPLKLKATRRGGAGGQQGKKATSKVPVCTSELREIFRNWPRLQNNIVFYHQTLEVTPPWKNQPVETMMNWALYAIHRQKKKHGDANPIAANMEILLGQQNFDEVIDLYHKSYAAIDKQEDDAIMDNVI